MRNLILATAAIPLVSLVAPASADTVVRRETTVITREVPPPVVEYRTYRAPAVHYYTAPRRHRYVSRDYYYTAPGYYTAPSYAYVAAGDCDWLYRRAVDTGSPYWWTRYHRCADW